jgi:hypothetical protein
MWQVASRIIEGFCSRTHAGCSPFILGQNSLFGSMTCATYFPAANKLVHRPNLEQLNIE